MGPPVRTLLRIMTLDEVVGLQDSGGDWLSRAGLGGAVPAGRPCQTLSVTRRARSEGSSTPNRTNLVVPLATAVGFGSVIAGYWEAVSSFSVRVGGKSYECGSPFSSRWFASGYDTASISSFRCGQDAPTRRFLTFLFCVIGVATFAAVLASVARIRRRASTSPSDRASTRLGLNAAFVHLGLGLLGLAAGLVLLVCAIFGEVLVVKEGPNPAASSGIATVNVQTHYT